MRNHTLEMKNITGEEETTNYKCGETHIIDSLL